MPLQFINRLNEEQIIELINYGNKKRDPEYFIEATFAKILNEPDRCDEYGNQEILVNAWNGNRLIGVYKIQDFKLCQLVYSKWEIRNDELREYLASIFDEDEEYLNGLREYYVMEAEKEIARIQNALGKSRS